MFISLTGDTDKYKSLEGYGSESVMEEGVERSGRWTRFERKV